MGIFFQREREREREWNTRALSISSITFIAPNRHKKTDSKAQQPRNKSKELNGALVQSLHWSGVVNLFTCLQINQVVLVRYFNFTLGTVVVDETQ